MRRKETNDLAKRRYRWLVRVATYAENVHREQIEKQLNPSPRETCLRGLFLRAALGLRTMKKLEQPSDLQALAACTRSLVEISVDMLLVHEDKGSACSERMEAWQESAKLKAAMLLVEHFRSQNREVPSEYKPQADFVDNKKSEIEKKRIGLWTFYTRGTNRDSQTSTIDEKTIERWKRQHPQRWTNRSLRDDMKIVDEHRRDWLLKVFGLTLTEFYRAELSWINWYVHGSTLTGINNISDETFTRLCARCYEVSAYLGMICAHIIQSDYRLFELFPEMQIEWERLLNHRDLARSLR